MANIALIEPRTTPTTTAAFGTQSPVWTFRMTLPTTKAASRAPTADDTRLRPSAGGPPAAATGLRPSATASPRLDVATVGSSVVRTLTRRPPVARSAARTGGAARGGTERSRRGASTTDAPHHSPVAHHRARP